MKLLTPLALAACFMTACLGTVDPVKAASLPVFDPKAYINQDTSGLLIAYADRDEVQPGGTVRLAVSSPGSSYEWWVNRYTDHAVQVTPPQTVAEMAQSGHLGRSAAGPGWPYSLSLTVPESWPPGLYSAVFHDPASGATYDVPFIVYDLSLLARTQVLQLVSNYTFQAYNTWGGASFYTCSVACNGKVAPVVSLRRPDPAATMTFGDASLSTRAAWTVSKWLTPRGWAPQYLTGGVLDACPKGLLGRKTLVIGPHDEYWTGNMKACLEKMLASGASVISLGANNAYWKIVARDGQIEVRKDRQVQTLDGSPGGLWRELGQPEAATLGTEFNPNNSPSYKTAAAYRVLQPEHWAFTGTGLKVGDLFAPDASAQEMDIVDQNSPANLVRLAKGVNPGGEGADMTVLETPAHGLVFSFSSLMVVRNLGDPVLSRILQNVLERIRARTQAGTP